MIKKKEQKMRVHSLAKDLGLSNKELLDLLEKEGIKVKSALSSITEGEAKKIKDKLKKKKKEKTEKGKKDKEKEKIEEEPLEKKEKAITKEEKIIKVKEVNPIRELSKMMNLSPSDIITACLKLGLQVNINQNLDFDTTSLIAEEFGYKAELSQLQKVDIAKKEEKVYNIQRRPPVVTVMGHVDHGKTTLLDYIRKTQVAKLEIGGITQKIGAYNVTYNNHRITFIDTPGHEAFTSMRARGANVTDIVVLVVAANEGVKAQTIEAINHAKAANVPIIVALNKIDLPTANPNKVLAELAEHKVVAHEYGGEVLAVKISALKGEGIDELLEAIILQAEDLNLKAPVDCPGRGVILETQIMRGIGNVATVIVKEGQIKIGDYFVAGETSGRVRLILDENNRKLKVADVSSAVLISQFDSLPKTGDIFEVVKDQKTARELIENRKFSEEVRKEKVKVSLSDLYQKMKEDKKQVLKLVVKGEDAGSVDALVKLLESLPKDKIQIKIIHSGIGPITESDVDLASVSEAIIIGFKVKPYPNVDEEARKKFVEIKTYDVIFDIAQDIRKAMLGLLEPEIEEVKCGEAEI
ncbi:MAG: translation initiation factor IF-2, partial [candidate division WOR-3 bacterium]